MRAEATGQGPRHPRILLQDNYTLNHTSPNLQPSSTADVNVGLGLRSGLKYYTPQTSKGSSRGGEIRHLPACLRLFCQRLEWFSLKLPVLLQQDLDLSFRLFQFLAAG